MAMLMLGAPDVSAQVTVNATNVQATTRKQGVGTPTVNEYSVLINGGVKADGTMQGQYVSYSITVKFEWKTPPAGLQNPQHQVTLSGNPGYWQEGYFVVKAAGATPPGPSQDFNIVVSGTFTVSGNGGGQTGTIPTVTVPCTVNYN